MSDLVLHTDIIKDATMTVSTETAGYEKEYLTDYSPGNTWRSTAITVTYITLDFGAAVTLKGTSYFGTNMVAGDTTFDFECSTDNFATTAFTEALTKTAKGHKEVNWTYRYFRYKIVKVLPATYIEIGKMRLHSGAFTLTRNMNRGWDEYKLKVFSAVKGDYGQGQRTLRYKKQIFKNMVFEFTADADKIIFDETISADPEISYYNDGHDEIYYGWMKFPNIRNRFIDLWDITGNFEEML